jgi:hypothetical protein
MRLQRCAWSLVAAGAIALTMGACNRQKAAQDVQQTEAVQPKAQPATVSGCLRRGDADNTFVLLSSESGSASTYKLVPAGNAQLADDVGKQVEVTGTVRADAIVDNKAAPETEKPKGTSGTPTVQTKSDLNVRWMDVSSVKPLGASCQP